MDPQYRKRYLDWIVDTCLLHGSQEHTAYLVAAEFAKGLAAHIDSSGAPQ
jgi:hypothetical protein